MPPGRAAADADAAAPLLGAAPPPSPFLAADAAGAPAGAPRAAGGVLRDKHGQPRSWADQRARTTALVYLAGTLERINEQVLPSLYKYVGRSLHASPRQLGYVTLACALAQAAAAPLGGLAGHYYNRATVLSLGCFLWAAMAALFATATSLSAATALWAVNGLGLALLIPNAQSLVADYYRPVSRGKAFGGLFFAGAAGATLGGAFAANMGGLCPAGLEGWRAAFLAVAALSAAAGAANLAFSVDPRYRADKREYAQAPDVLKVGPLSARRMAAELGSVLAVPSFAIIILQGVVGNIPWAALVFNTYYLQLKGLSDLHASLVASLFLAGTALGAALGGAVGDWAATRAPHHGRILVAQASVAAGVPAAFLIFLALPDVGVAAPTPRGLVALYGASYFAWGALISWPGASTTSPILGEVVPAQQRSLVYSFDRAFEGALAAAAAPLVGFLAERAGFHKEGDQGGGPDPESARALGSAMLAMTAVPWTLCCCFFTPLHITYRRDRAAAAAYQRARSGFVPASSLPPGEAEEGGLAAFGLEGDAEDAAYAAASLAALGTARMPLPEGEPPPAAPRVASAACLAGLRLSPAPSGVSP